MYSSMGGGIIGLEMPLKTQNHVQKHIYDQQQQTQLSMKQPNYASYNPNTNPNPTQNHKVQATQLNSDEDDDQETSSNSLKRKSSGNSSENVAQWQRMKWTDNMVRLLIMAVYYIGDETGGGPETGPEKKKGSLGSGHGAMQKKGKWKSVSRAMMEKGFYVSPQQCEDKFNDLNKRYKRVNDILGKGTSCKVVENISLLDDLGIDVKLKDEVRKLLNSKHLFFREMCAYHTSCAHAHAHAGAENATVSVVVSVKQQPIEQHQHVHADTPVPVAQACLHATPSVEDYEDGDGDDEDEDEDEVEEGNVRKRARTGMREIDDHWSGEVMRVLQDGSKSSWEKKQWVMNQMVELEENGIKIQSEGLELEKERLKWMKFSSKKERDMEKMRIENEKKRLENQRMLLLLKKNEIDFSFLHQPTNPSCLSM